jgi:hypothetical protein
MANMRRQLDDLQRALFEGNMTHDVENVEGAVANPMQLPRKYRPRDPKWASEVVTKLQLQQEANGGGGLGTGQTAFGELSVTDRDIRNYQAIQEQQESLAFDKWFGEHFNKADLPTRRLGEELNPEYFEEREKALVEKYDIKLRLDLIKLYGPRDEKDLMILFGLQNGLLREDVGAENADDQDTRFYYGMGQLSRFLYPDDVLRMDDANLFKDHANAAQNPWGAAPLDRPGVDGEDDPTTASYRTFFT